MRYLLSILCFTYLFSIEITVGDARSVPEFGFNGNTVRGPSWLNSEFTDSVGTMKPHLLRYPGGLATYWDWSAGWFFDFPTIDTLIIDSLPNNWSSLPYIDIRPIHFHNACNTIDSEGLFVMNMVTTDLDTMLTWVEGAINDGINITKIELGSEINHDNEYKILKYPTAGDYARDCQRYIDSLDVIVPNANFTLVGGNRGDTERAAHWNDSLYVFINPESFDALSWHIYLYMKDEHATFSNRKFLGYPYYDIPRIEEWRGFQDTTSQIQNHKINVTEYNLFDKSTEKIYRNTWLHALFLSSMNDNILDNSLVNMVLAHNVGGPTGFDAISNDPVINFEKHATGFTGMLYNMVSKDMTETFKLNFPATFSDTLEYANSNDVIKEVSCPRIFGWKFSNNQKESGILTNITDSTYSISVENAYSSDLLWTHWTAADTLRAYISGYDSIERNYQTGKTNISIPPFSLNTCITFIEGDINQDDILNVLDIVMIVNFIINENTISNKQFAISDLNLDEIINVLDIVVLVSLILANGS
jgi:hypothetical protein